MSMPTIAITPTSVRGARKQIQAQRARGFTLMLAFPASELMQNRHDGRHWSYAAGEKADARREGYLQALATMTEAGYEPPPTGCYRVSMVFAPPDRRRRDVSNLHAAMKAHLDGIAQAMGVDDAMFIEHSQRMTGVPNDGRGHVIVTIQEIA
jgi:crossover junction endodeoxyribonuclease RusA